MNTTTHTPPESVQYSPQQKEHTSHMTHTAYISGVGLCVVRSHHASQSSEKLLNGLTQIPPVGDADAIDKFRFFLNISSTSS